jgi:hypothetical protein
MCISLSCRPKNLPEFGNSGSVFKHLQALGNIVISTSADPNAQKLYLCNDGCIWQRSWQNAWRVKECYADSH